MYKIHVRPSIQNNIYDLLVETNLVHQRKEAIHDTQDLILFGFVGNM